MEVYTCIHINFGNYTCMYIYMYMHVFTQAIMILCCVHWMQEIIVLAETAKNETLICPLCKGVFRDPHIATCGVNPVNYGAAS